MSFQGSKVSVVCAYTDTSGLFSTEEQAHGHPSPSSHRHAPPSPRGVVPGGRGVDVTVEEEEELLYGEALRIEEKRHVTHTHTHT